MQELVMFKECLYSAFYDWLKNHRETIGEKRYEQLLKEVKKSWKSCRTPIDVMAIAMWIFNMIANLGILAGLGPCSVKVEKGWIPDCYDEKLTMRVLTNCSSCLALQYLPKEFAKENLPEGQMPWRFKLTDYAAHH